MTRPEKISIVSRKCLIPLAIALFAGPLSAQTPTPTATPTPTVTPTPPPGTTVVSAGVTRYAIPNGGRYDAANMVVEPDGTLWSASGAENVVVKISSDRTTATRYAFPKDATPSSFLREPDGTLWITELGGFNISHFDPATRTLRRWPDAGRRPTMLARRSDGTFWLPETSGALTKFDPSNGTYTYYRAGGIFSLSYPWLDPDGTLWTCDFIVGAIVRFSADGSHATYWRLPNSVSGPSRIIRGPDGKLWLTLYYSGQLARFDPETNQLELHNLSPLELPYDLTTYRGLLVYSEQRYGYVGFYDPRNPFDDDETLTPVEAATASTVVVVAPTTTVLAAAAVDGLTGALGISNGFRGDGQTHYQVGSGATYALAIDEPRGRIYFGTLTTIGAMTPPPPLSPDTSRYLPSAASIAGRYGTRWTTELVAWNRGTPDSTNTRNPLLLALQLLPSTWILGFSPQASTSVEPDKLKYLSDPIGQEMSGPDSYGGFRITPSTAADDSYAWSRVCYTRPEGGTYGFARNTVRVDEGIAAGETASVFAAPDAETQRTNAGLLTLEASKGSISIVDTSGATLGSFSYDWPAGYHWQGSTIFQHFGLPPIPNARVVFTVTTGRVLPFGTSIDNSTNDPIGLDVFGPRNAFTSQRLLGASRGAGPLGSASRTALQLYSGTAAAAVTLTFRPAAADGQQSAAAVTSTLSVPAGQVVHVPDVLADLGVTAGFGSLELTSDVALQAFARVTAPASAAGTFGQGIAGAITSIEATKRGVLLGASENDSFTTDLVLANLSDAAATVDVVLTNSEGAPSGARTVTLAAKAVVSIPAVWAAIGGGGETDLGRVDVVPADGSGAVAAALLRKDSVTGDVDAIFPFVIAR